MLYAIILWLTLGGFMPQADPWSECDQIVPSQHQQTNLAWSSKGELQKSYQQVEYGWEENKTQGQDDPERPWPMIECK